MSTAALRDQNGDFIYEPGTLWRARPSGGIDEYQRAQVSINLTDFDVTPPHTPRGSGERKCAFAPPAASWWD
jgi:hypothetical protein